ncbi:sodium channel subunit beta-3-like [Scomber scombrus]|uniref:sodium channel subunit beta-3-like n=1 Tax=Scomber scombrus TaxID=13677 RepID=UPI002DDA1CDB|nr:sodium channel subunit beta-3-like [Scomber scombrus]
MDSLKGLVMMSLICVSQGQQQMSVSFGDNVTLQCQSLKHELITVLKWIRPELKSSGYVFFYRNKRSYRSYQHPSFVDRVQLKDPEMKDGDASVTLHNVNLNDTGTYECHVSVRSSGLSKRVTSEVTHFINLTVTDSGQTRESKSENITTENTEGNIYYAKDVMVSNHSGFVVVVAVAVVVAVGVVVVAAVAVFLKKYQTYKTG